jgi:hypothetical protein
MSRVKISLGNFSHSLSQEAIARHSSLITDSSMPLREYEVRSPVRRENLVQFLSWIEHQSEINITAANISDFSLLSDEFGSLELTARSGLFSSSTVDFSNFQNYNQQIESLSNRLVSLEERVSSSQWELRSDCEGKLADMKSKCEHENETQVARIVSVERRISDLFSPFTSRLSVCEGSLGQMKSKCDNQNRSLVTRIETVEGSVSLLVREFGGKFADSTSRVTALNNTVQVLKDILHVVECPLKMAGSVDGIISYLTRKHGGNVHDKRIVTLTARSVSSCYALRSVADPSGRSDFYSDNAPGQWVCWHFREMRVRPTHYTMKTLYLKSWVVESSLDGQTWIGIDRKTDNKDFKEGNWETVSFAVSNSTECHFIRLTQTGKRHFFKDHNLPLRGVEFFGILLE